MDLFGIPRSCMSTWVDNGGCFFPDLFSEGRVYDDFYIFFR